MPRSKRPRKRYRGQQADLANASTTKERLARETAEKTKIVSEPAVTPGPETAHRARFLRPRYLVPVAAGGAVAGGAAYAMHRRRRQTVAKAMIDPLSGEPVFFEARDPLEGVVGKAAQLGTMPRLTGTGRGHTAEGSNVSHANRLSHTRHKPHRNPTGKLFVLHHGRRSKSGSGMGR